MRDGGTIDEFTRLFNEHSRALRRFTLRRLNDVKSCEDVVADTFLIAWRRWDDLPEHERELQLLYGIAYRVLSNQRRSRDRRERLRTRLSLERDPHSDGDESDFVDAVIVRRALDQLRSTDRELLEFVYWERLTYREIAKIIGVSENAVGIRINRAKLVLKALLSSEQGDSSSPSIFGREFES